MREIWEVSAVLGDGGEMEYKELARKKGLKMKAVCFAYMQNILDLLMLEPDTTFCTPMGGSWGSSNISMWSMSHQYPPKEPEDDIKHSAIQCFIMETYLLKSSQKQSRLDL